MTFRKAPQERSTPYQFDGQQVIPNARARTIPASKASAGGVRIERRHRAETRYNHALTVEGPEGVRELRDFLNAWLEHHEDGDEADAPDAEDADGDG